MARMTTSKLRKLAKAWAKKQGWRFAQKKQSVLVYRDDEHDKTIVLHLQEDWDAAGLWMRVTFSTCIAAGSTNEAAHFYLVGPDEDGCRDHIERHATQRALSRVSFALMATDGSAAVVPPPPKPERKLMAKEQARLGIWPPVIEPETGRHTFARHLRG